MARHEKQQAGTPHAQSLIAASTLSPVGMEFRKGPWCEDSSEQLLWYIPFLPDVES